MHPQSNPDRQPGQPHARKPYVAPVLRTYGTLQSLTAGGSTGNIETGPGYLRPMKDYP